MAIPAAAGPIGAALISGGFSAFGQSRANREARAAAQRQMDFQERMFKNRYRYTMADMRAAGLNPILAYQQGGGSPPSGASYTPQNVYAGVGEAAGHGVSSSMAAIRLKKELKLMDEQIEKTKQEGYTTSHLGAEALSRTHLNQIGVTTAKASAAGAKHYLQMMQGPAGKYIKGLEAIGRALNPGASAFSNLRR